MSWDGRMYEKYKITHADGTPLKGKKYFVLRLDSEDPEEAERVNAAMSAYKGEAANAAAMREALEKVLECINLNLTCSVRMDGTHDIRNYKKIVKDAIAAPPRNCDIYKTNHDAWLAWEKHCEKTDTYDDIDEVDLYGIWLFSKPKGGTDGK